MGLITGDVTTDPYIELSTSVQSAMFAGKTTINATMADEIVFAVQNAWKEREYRRDYEQRRSRSYLFGVTATILIVIAGLASVLIILLEPFRLPSSVASATQLKTCYAPECRIS